MLLRRGTHTWIHLQLSLEGSVPSSINTSLLPHLGTTLAGQPLFSGQHPTVLTQQLIRPCLCNTFLTSQPEWKSAPYQCFNLNDAVRTLFSLNPLEQSISFNLDGFIPSSSWEKTQLILLTHMDVYSLFWQLTSFFSFGTSL